MNRIALPKDEELDDQKVEALAAWVADNVPSAPAGQLCEADDCHGMDYGEDRPLADGTFSFEIQDGHVCYTYVCEACQENLTPAEEYIFEQGYPSEEGFAVTPKHCM